jgi:hypothetical protein
MTAVPLSVLRMPKSSFSESSTTKCIGRDAMFPSVMASDSAHNPNALPVGSLQQPQIFRIHNPTFRVRAMDMHN